MKISCIIPAYNEEKSIKKVIEKVQSFVDEIIVVDDCSSDRTKELAQQTNAIVLHHIINRGQGASLQTGNEYALEHGTDIIIHFDGDDQFQAEEIPDLMQPLINNEADAVLGSRFLNKKSKLPYFKQHFIFPLAKIINKLFFNIKLTDPQSGFRALKKEVVEKITIEHDGMAHCSEILHQLHKNKFKIKEVPITVIYHKYGQNFSGGIRILKDITIKKIIK